MDIFLASQNLEPPSTQYSRFLVSTTPKRMASATRNVASTWVRCDSGCDQRSERPITPKKEWFLQPETSNIGYLDPPGALDRLQGPFMMVKFAACSTALGKLHVG